MKHLPRLLSAALAIALIAACGDSDETATTTAVPSSTTAATTVTSTTQATTTVATTAPSTTTSAATTTLPPSTTTTLRPDPAEGWGRLDVDTSVFGGLPIVDGAISGTRWVLVGSDPVFSAGFPVWWAEGGSDFTRATGPDDVLGVTQVEATPFGWYAVGGIEALWSADGSDWVRLGLANALGYEELGQLGSGRAVFVSPAGDRVTLLFSRAAEAESTIATLVTTTDGETWTEEPRASAELFDSSTISLVAPGGDGLLAAGASPGGEFVPTAAVFTSPDGLEWRRLTPTGSADFDDKVINDLRQIGERFVAVGGDFFTTGLMTAWTSPDGLTWTRAPHPDETTDPSVAQMTATAVTAAEGYIWAGGVDFDARRSDPQSLPALWRSRDGEQWERIELADLEVTVPFGVASSPDLRIGVWPPPGSAIDEPTVVFAAD